MTIIAARFRACRRAAFAALTLAAASVGSAFAQPTPEEVVDQVSAYLNSVETIAGEFVQIEPGAVITEGEYAIWRPGRMYFRYAPPSQVRVISDGIWVGVLDEEDDKTVERWPLFDTPLHLLLADDVDLRGENAVAGVVEDDQYYRLTLVDPSGDVGGNLEVVLDKAPLRLREWTVTDAEGYTTRVVLRTATFNERVEPEIFVIPDQDQDGFDR